MSAMNPEIKKREPLRELSKNVQNQKFSIFNDKGPIKSVTKERGSKAAQQPEVSTLQGIIKLQQFEIKRLRLKCSFLEFAGQVQKQIRSRHSGVVPHSSTPKKRRLESHDVEEDEDSLEYSQGTPAKLPPSTMMTPVSILKSGNKKSTSSASLLRQFARSPEATPRANGGVDNQSVERDLPSRKAVVLGKNSFVPLMDRLKSVDDGLKQDEMTQGRSSKESDEEDDESEVVYQEVVKQYRSEISSVDSKGRTSKGNKRQPSHPPAVSTAPQDITSSSHPVKTAVNVVDPASSSKSAGVPQTTKAQASHYREHMSIPIVKEHTTFRDVVAEATTNSIKTLYSRQQHRTDKYKNEVKSSAVVTPDHSASNNSNVLYSPNEDSNSIQNTLARYRRNNEKLSTEEMQQKFYHLATNDTNVTPMKGKSNSVDAALMDATRSDRNSLLEKSVLNYHHTHSVVTPLTALGQQSVQSPNGTPAVALTQLTSIQSQMSNWKDKYASSS